MPFGHLRELVAAIGRVSKVPLFEDDNLKNGTLVPSASLVLQPELVKRRIRVAGTGATAAEWMAALEVATGGRWYFERGNWVLAESPKVARLCVLSWVGRHEVMTGSFEQAVRSLTARQLRVLSATGVLRPSDLTFPQRQMIAHTAEATSVIYGNVAREAMDLREVSLRLITRNAEVPPNYQLECYLPRRGGQTESSMALLDTDFPFPFRPPPGGVPRLPPSQPTAPWDRPSLPLPQPPAAVSWKDDPALATRFGARPAQMAVLVAQIAAAAKVNVMTSTRYESILRLEPREMTVAEALESIAQRTGGTWAKVGGTYVLRPEPTLEELAQMDRELLRRHWLPIAAAAAGRQFTKRQREAFDEHGELTPEQLSAEQKRATRWVVALAFGLGKGVPASALDLTGVTLRVVKLPSGRSLHFMLPQLEGPPEVEAWVPYNQ